MFGPDPNPAYDIPSYDMSNKPRFKDLKDKLCPMCQKLDLEDILNPDHFVGLPPWTMHEAAPWYEYIRPIYKYNLPGVNDYAHYCTFCFFLRQLAQRIEKLPVPKSDPWLNTTIPDGDGFVLAAVPASLVYPDDAPPEARLQADRSSIFLLVLCGSNVLERLAYENRSADVPARQVVVNAVHHAKHMGTLISCPASKTAGPSVEYRLVDVENPDYTHIRSWIDTCLDTHPACKERSTVPPVPRMRVIDCTTRTIVKHKPGQPYAALSYVWGTGPPDPYVYPNLSDLVPNVINDAMTATKKLGIPYLWVDRYCIWQDDPTQSHKMEQINAMGQIYGGATITIVSTAGGGSYGMPGVGGGRSLYYQIPGRFRDVKLVADYGWQAQELVLGRSKWQTRGWTFQEWILSSRILVFSPYRVSYECAGMQCIEQLNCPIGVNVDRPQRRQHDDLYRPEGALSYLISFSQRQLTYESDALNAMSGILQTWIAANPGAAHFMGMPVILPSKETRTAKTLFLALWAGLTWQTMDVRVRSVRRTGMPTWSPIGIRGAMFRPNVGVETGYRTTRGDPEVPVLEGEVSLELMDGAVHSLEEFVRADMHKTDGSRSIAALHLTGWCFTLGSFVERDGKYYFQLPAETGNSEGLRFIPDIGKIDLDKAPDGRFEAISPYSAEDTSYCAVVCERSGDGMFFKRVGKLLLYQNQNLEEPGARRFFNPRDILQARWSRVRIV
ncbi:heterokaryon incompatibility protein-domain-containing protein [Plectosphaerella plurivora]|uniref:Heterokaryon incompatibility protein-domain-containing protein n=1 Tax=Plectosphaerella plurivora TaxID=936078 RepID=A0A9P8V6W2_9PEZI|nr:heterokaryon incompatibility protein-domain-containing protein [Plectosphaerella plurivora]